MRQLLRGMMHVLIATSAPCAAMDKARDVPPQELNYLEELGYCVGTVGCRKAERVQEIDFVNEYVEWRSLSTSDSRLAAAFSRVILRIASETDKVKLCTHQAFARVSFCKSQTITKGRANSLSAVIVEIDVDGIDRVSAALSREFGGIDSIPQDNDSIAQAKYFSLTLVQRRLFLESCQFRRLSLWIKIRSVLRTERMHDNFWLAMPWLIQLEQAAVNCASPNTYALVDPMIDAAMAWTGDLP